MIWKEYIEGYGNLDAYMKEIHGERGKYMIKALDERIPVPLDDKFSTVDDINNIVFGQFIMAERALTSGTSYEESLYNLSVSILRPITDVVFDNTDDKKEKDNVELIMQQKASDVRAECIIFSNKRNKFVKEDFKGVFYKAEDANSSDDEMDDNAEESFEESFNRDWYWYTMVDALSNNQLWMHETIYMMKMRDVAPHLAYLRMKGIIEYKRRKMEDMTSKLKRRG